MKYYILYNPLAGHGETRKNIDELKSHLDGECVEYNVTEITDYPGIVFSLQPEDKLVISGGDGTLNNFINSVDIDNITNEVLYYASGSGNDFLHDVNPDYDGKPFIINQYLKNLPTVTVKGKTYRFINGIGYGIDGWCCEIGDQLKAKGKAVNYTSIAIKGLIYAYKPRNAKVTVDGKEYKRIPLSQPQTVTVRQADGCVNTVEVTERGAVMQSSTSTCGMHIRSLVRFIRSKFLSGRNS